MMLFIINLVNLVNSIDNKDKLSINSAGVQSLISELEAVRSFKLSGHKAHHDEHNS